jgi:hypothetical protein
VPHFDRNLGAKRVNELAEIKRTADENAALQNPRLGP